MKSSDDKMPQSAPSNAMQPPARVSPSAKVNEYSMIGKSIVVKGEITASDPLYIYGRVEGLINAPAHRVTVGKEGKVQADISAREVVIMGDVCGNLNGGDRVEIRRDGSLTGNLAAHRICIEDGAFLKGAIDVLQASETDEAETLEEPLSALEPEEATPTAESDLDRRTWESAAVPELD